MLYSLKKWFSEKKFNKNYRRKNKNNKTIPVNRFDINSVIIGDGTYGPIEVYKNGGVEKLFIGKYCSIGPRVTFILTADHPTNYFSTYPWKVMNNKAQYEAISKGDIVLGDDVWIGANSIILSGVNVGRGAVIAAGSIVTKNIPDYAIVAGNPAQIVKYRFEKEIIDEIKQISFDNFVLDDKLLELLYKKIETIDDVRKIKESIRNQRKEK